MKKVMSILLLGVMALSLFVLTGCSSEESIEEGPGEETVLACMQKDGIKVSSFGDNLTYYYIGPDDLSIYYVTDWKKGVVSLKRYFWSQEKYELQKDMYKDAKLNDNELTIYQKEYTNVADMDTYWTEIENSQIYKMIK